MIREQTNLTSLTIDGSYGEGGGQILRTALSLSALLGRAVRLVNIRAGRPKPGLRPQHVQAVKAAAAICNARLEGAHEGSSELTFAPQSPVKPGTYRFHIGTAGSASLVLQTVLAPLALCQEASRVTVIGGTHVAWSPPADYLKEVYLPALAPLGFSARLDLRQWGYYPKGGGEIRALIEPRQPAFASPPPWTGQRGALERLHILSAASNLENQVAARQAKQAYNRLAGAGLQPWLRTQILNPSARGPGSFIFLLAQYEGGTRAGFSGFGRKGYPAERVADDAVDGFLAFHASGASVDLHLADQLVLPLALTDHGLAFSTSQISPHLRTNIWVASRFLGEPFEIEQTADGPPVVRFLGS